MKQRFTFPPGRSLLPILAVLAALLWLLSAVKHVRTGRLREEREQLELALRRAAVACYAAEGIYPPDTDHIVRHYGVQIDGERFTVHYDIFADNLMPHITVLERTS